ncbi:MAG: hypothetical protein ABSC06_19715 [Rhodopila sp.]|jgi:hypothetical protein
MSNPGARRWLDGSEPDGLTDLQQAEDFPSDLAATRYLDKVILSYNLARNENEPWTGAREGLVYYAQTPADSDDLGLDRDPGTRFDFRAVASAAGSGRPA